MDGDIAPVRELSALAERHDAWLLLDDAHGFGVLGHSGRGAPSHFGVGSPRLVYMATLGKAAGVCGAFVAGAPEVVETLVQRARPYVYTTASPPLLAVALMKSLELLESEEWRRERLRNLVALLRERLRPARWRLTPSETAIQPLVIGTSAEAMAVSEALARQGLLVPAIRPPTVPQGTARLRISLSAAHELEDVERLAAALNELEGRIEPPRRQDRQGNQ
jgi:8-amino-7-oxononanoate synthase